jgi:predicted outer membrane lipoprotein
MGVGAGITITTIIIEALHAGGAGGLARGSGVVWVWLRLGVPAACAFGFARALVFLLHVLLVCSRLDVSAAFAGASLMLALFFIFIDPCAGRHSLSLLRQRK